MPRKRCHECSKKINVMNEFQCRCKLFFCSEHRLADDHNCTFNYKEYYRKIIESKNIKVIRQKVEKI